MKKSEYIKALRDLADYVETRNFPESRKQSYGPNVQDLFDTPSLSFWVYDRKDFGAVAAAMGTFEKSVSEYSTSASFTAPNFAVRLTATRETVCTKKVVGTRTVPAKAEEVIPAEEEHEEDVVQWECPESFVALAQGESNG